MKKNSLRTFRDFLVSKPLFYKAFDPERIRTAYARLAPHLRTVKAVHIVGTNGKGSTGRAIAHLAYRSGMRVGHYSSPHIVRFNERIWLNGEEVDDTTLQKAHERLYAILGAGMSEALSYFEYTTLLAFIVFEGCELVVLEAGLGGEFDATNVYPKALSVVTPIGIDHQAFLGESIDAIAETKLRSIDRAALIAPQPFEQVIDIARRIARDKGARLRVAEVPDPRIGIRTAIETTAGDKGWPRYLCDNITVAVQALDELGIAYRIDDIRTLELFGRFYPWASNVRLDVGHNPLAARAIVDAMEPQMVLIYHALEDKDAEAVLQTLRPKLKRVEIIPIDTPRAMAIEKLEAILERLRIPYGKFEKIQSDETYLVFGSFHTVEAFLKTVQVSR